jgi:hypothetical protein
MPSQEGEEEGRVTASTRRRIFARGIAAIVTRALVPAAVAACGVTLKDGSPSSSGAKSAASDPWSGISGQGTARIQAIVPATDLAVGPNRFSLGLLHFPENANEPQRLADATLRLTFFFPIEPSAVARGNSVTATYRWVDVKGKGIYVTRAEFDQSGMWGVEVNGDVAGRTIGPARTRFPVKVKPDTPAIGSDAPRSRNLTARDVSDIKLIDSGVVPNDMHDLTIADAIATGKPLVVVFATPGFCATQTCAPVVEEMSTLKRAIGGAANFVHVEIYKDPKNRIPYDTVTEWGLTSEPWVFLVDKRGKVAAKFEGPAPQAEVEEELRRLL